VHVPLPGDISLLGLLTALRLRKPLLARYGGSWGGDGETTLMNRVTRSCIRRFAGGRNVMLVTGEGPAPPAPGVSWIFSTALTDAELAAIRPATHAALRNPPSLVYAGRLSPEKGVDVLLEAVALLRRERLDPMPIVRICGDGPERAPLERLAGALGIADLVTFAGQLDRGGLGEVFLSADLCVQPSRTEGFSKAWLDAMAHGLPVVTSDVGAARAVIGADGERGWVTAPGDAPALAGRLREILGPGAIDWRALRARCRAHVEGRTLEAWASEVQRRCTAAWGRPTKGASS
jgi:glycosyltransferase involved in cell wall biosynthesis